jgi:hypothetical protein
VARLPDTAEREKEKLLCNIGLNTSTLNTKFSVRCSLVVFGNTNERTSGLLIVKTGIKYVEILKRNS